MADMIEGGNIHVGDVATSMPNDIEYELQLEEDLHEGKLAIEMEWRR
jgi:hypothetical protein